MARMWQSWYSTSAVVHAMMETVFIFGDSDSIRFSFIVHQFRVHVSPNISVASKHIWFLARFVKLFCLDLTDKSAHSSWEPYKIHEWSWGEDPVICRTYYRSMRRWHLSTLSYFKGQLINNASIANCMKFSQIIWSGSVQLIKLTVSPIPSDLEEILPSGNLPVNG